MTVQIDRTTWEELNSLKISKSCAATGEEITRLREALRDVLYVLDNYDCTEAFGDMCIAKARAALTDAPAPQEKTQ